MTSSTSPIRFAGGLQGVSLTAPPKGPSTEDLLREEIERVREEAYLRGLEDGRSSARAELQEQRDALSLFQEGTLHTLARQNETLVEQIGALLPQLALEVTQRVLAGFEPDQAHIAKMVDEVLSEISGSSGTVEVWLSERDLALVTDISPELVQRHPGVRLIADPEMQPGDCRARSRFGTIDARLSTKLKNVAKSLGQ